MHDLSLTMVRDYGISADFGFQLLTGSLVILFIFTWQCTLHQIQVHLVESVCNIYEALLPD